MLKNQGGWCPLNEVESGLKNMRCCKNFPETDGDDEAALDQWLKFYTSDKWEPTPPPYGSQPLAEANASAPFSPLAVGNYLGSCYTPWNMMSRALTCDALSSHRANSLAEATPDIEQARTNLERVNFVGIVELYSESMCLFEYRLMQTLPVDCTCAHTDVLWEGSMKATHKNHHESGGAALEHGKESHSTDAMLDKLTRIDVEIYQMGILRFVRDMAELQRRSGQRVVCPSRFNLLRDAVAYIPGLWDEVLVVVGALLALPPPIRATNESELQFEPLLRPGGNPALTGTSTQVPAFRSKSPLAASQQPATATPLSLRGSARD